MHGVRFVYSVKFQSRISKHEVMWETMCASYQFDTYSVSRTYEDRLKFLQVVED